MKVGLCNLGCKVNTYEMEYIASLFKERGYEISDFNDFCDVYVVNTCTVTNNSDVKSRKMINHPKKINKNCCLVVCGCFIESAKDYKNDDIDIVLGNYNKSKVVDLVEEFFRNKEKINQRFNLNEVEFEDMNIKHFENRTRAFVKIQDGCENFCTYCIIPYVRGKCRSKKEDNVLSEITTLVNNGYNEIVLTGIHTGNYGVDINTNFSSILEKILNIKGLKRLRISSIEITELDDKFLELLKNPILCNHLHIPLQSGGEKTLKRMNRKYDKKYFKEEIEKIRKVRPDISITTDVIVGFPGETEDDFNECVDFIKEINFSKLHVFPYSKRDGTVAAKMKDQIDGKVKKERVKTLLDLSKTLEENYNNSFIGKKESCLIEKVDCKYSYGHCSNYVYLKIPKIYKENEIVDIIIEKNMLVSKN
ncbi:tRNA methylthiotransferase YqeV [Mycoplasma sp. CAG:611]|nr:tRNA methylthiotransferase YqeV [Mycoplasma sp. CAG:611]